MIRIIDESKSAYELEFTCSKSFPESIICYLESATYEETIRKAISMGGDADTMACIAGGIVSATNDMRVPDDLTVKAFEYLPNEYKNIIIDFTKLIA